MFLLIDGWLGAGLWWHVSPEWGPPPATRLRRPPGPTLPHRHSPTYHRRPTPSHPAVK